MKDWPWYGHIFMAFLIFAALYLLYFKPKNEELKQLRAERIQTEQTVLKQPYLLRYNIVT